jgi:hypothetical protein
MLRCFEALNPVFVLTALRETLFRCNALCRSSVEPLFRAWSDIDAMLGHSGSFVSGYSRTIGPEATT